MSGGWVDKDWQQLVRIAAALERIADALEAPLAERRAALVERHALLMSRYRQAAERFERDERMEWRANKPSPDWVRRHAEDEEQAAALWDQIQAFESAHRDLMEKEEGR